MVKQSILEGFRIMELDLGWGLKIGYEKVKIMKLVERKLTSPPEKSKKYTKG